jgi:hypothetical protein
MRPEHDEFLRSCEEKGEEEVKRILARGGWNERRSKWAEAWLAGLDDTREARRARENLQIAASARTAAWIAAIAAIIANVLAVVALIFSYLAWAP